MYCRTLSSVEHFTLDHRRVDVLSHFAAEGVNFPDKMALAGAADRRVARHHRHGIQIDGQQQRLVALARRGQSGFAPSVARTDDDGFITFSLICHNFFLSFLFSETEICKNLIDNVVSKRLTGDFSQIVQRILQIDGDDID